MLSQLLSPACQVTYLEPYQSPGTALCCGEDLIVNEGSIEQLVPLLPHFLSQNGEMSWEMGLQWALAWSLLLHSCLAPTAKKNPML